MRILKSLTVSALSLIALSTMVSGAGSATFLSRLSMDLPEIDKITKYEPEVPVKLLSQDGSVLYEMGDEKREVLPISGIPKLVQDAFIVTEDKNFWEHAGYDPVAIMRAAITNFRADRVSSGASTITQQLVKNVVLSSEQSFERKAKEALLAFQVENALPKEKILEIYLNEIYFGRGAYGIGRAAQVYFNKGLVDLDVDEVAFLAGLPKAPSKYSTNLDDGRNRRDFVLSRMRDEMVISEEQYRTAQSKNLVLADRQYQKPSHYVTEALRQLKEYDISPQGDVVLHMDREVQSVAQRHLFIALSDFEMKSGWKPQDLSKHALPNPNWISAQISLQEGKIVALSHEGDVIPFSADALGHLANVDQDVPVGQNIWVTLNSDGEADLRMRPSVNGAIVVVDATNGAVLALVGGFSDDGASFNRATQAMRQPGSTLKPFVYAAALQEGWQPLSPILDGEIALKDGASDVWRPDDRGHTSQGYTTLRMGLEKSRNTVTLRLSEAIGYDRIAEVLRSSGLFKDREVFASSVLGGQEVSLISLVGAYTSLVSGSYREPKIIDLPDADTETTEAILFDDITQAQISSMLHGVTTRGTARRAFQGFEGYLSGKTGTSNDAKDAFFIGYSGDIIIGAYVGYDTPKTLGSNVTGGNTAAPIVRKIFEEIGVEKTPPEIPNGVSLLKVDIATGRPDQAGFLELVRK